MYVKDIDPRYDAKGFGFGYRQGGKYRKGMKEIKLFIYGAWFLAGYAIGLIIGMF